MIRHAFDVTGGQAMARRLRRGRSDDLNPDPDKKRPGTMARPVQQGGMYLYPGTKVGLQTEWRVMKTPPLRVSNQTRLEMVPGFYAIRR